MKKSFGLLLLLQLGVFALFGQQPFSKKMLGTYLGTQDTYSVILDEEALVIPQETQIIKLQYPEIILETTNNVLRGNYLIAAETKEYYALQVRLENGIVEEWRLFKKGNQLIRLEKNPRPEIVFVKR